MKVSSRTRPVFQITGVGPYAAAAARRRRRWPWVITALLLLVAAALGYAHFAWPRGALSADSAGLARLAQPSFGGGNLRISARTADGKAVPVELRAGGVVWPKRPVAPGTRLAVDATFRRPSWVGWIAGRTQHLRLWITAPAVSVEQRWLQVRPGTSLRLRFDRPVSEVRVSGLGRIRVVHPSRPARTIAIGQVPAAGTVGVTAVVRRWEQAPAPAAVTWFPTGARSQMIASPRPGTQLGAGTQLVLQFSRPLAQVFHGHLPWVEQVPGGWHAADAHTLVFTPRGFGFGLDTPVRLHLPAWVQPVDAGGATQKATRLLTWTTPTGSELRLQQLLAELGYLPLRWHAAGAEPKPTTSGELAAAVHPPAGTFTWRYENIPGQLRSLWQPGRENSIVRGAIMAFESDHDLTTDGDAGRTVWQALISAATAGRTTTAGYSYVIVHAGGSPETLVLWHDGHTMLQTPANTGIAAAPTAFGTFPVYARFRVTTMSGTAPDGSHYSDPGIPWVSYFNGGDAIHGFTRASYGSPQSLGCVELPAYEAAKVWPYTPLGTLVTVTG